MRCIMAGMECCLVDLCLLCATTGALGLEVQKTVGLPQLQPYNTVVDISFVVQRLIPMVLVTVETLQWHVDKVSMHHYAGRLDFPVVVQRQIPMVRTRRTTEISPVASQGDRCPCWWFDGAETVVVPQLQFIEDRRLPLPAAETALHGPAFSEDHRVSSVTVCCLVVDAPVMQVVFHARCCTTGAHGSDSAELRGSVAVAVPSWL